MKLSDHIALSRQNRQNHLNLSTPCDLPEDCVSRSGRRYRLKQRLLKLLDLENDIPRWKKPGYSIELTHQCENHSRSELCCNPFHVSFGTCSENAFDISEERRKTRGKERNMGFVKEKFVSLTDGFVGTYVAMRGHTKSLNHDYNFKLKLSREEEISLIPILEEFTWEKPRGDRPGKFRTIRGLRVPFQILETLRNRVKT